MIIKCYFAIEKKINKSLLHALYFFIIIYTYLSTNTSFAQTYFRYPLDSLASFVSPFGALRDNHFHSGVDLKTKEREGLPIYASADGYISRIKIQSIGYGKAIYINHQNGYTTVYGHLLKYHSKIAQWVLAYQYKNKSFEFDKVFDNAILYVKKGDTIGFSGNSGSSTGPHLHYEIRNTSTEEVLNPALFGMLPFDTLRPVINKIFFYNFSSNEAYIVKEIDVNKQSVFTQDSLLIYKDTITIYNNFFAIGIETFDYIHNAFDKKYIYTYDCNFDNKHIFGFKLNKFSFDESKYINTHIDFAYYKRFQTRIQKCFLDDGNEINLYTYDNNKGKITLNDNGIHQLKISVSDASGNTSKILLYVRLSTKKNRPSNRQKYSTVFYPYKDNIFKKNDFKITLNSKSIYDTIFFDYAVLPKQKYAYSKTYQVHKSTTAMHKAADIAIKVIGVKKQYQSKLLLAYFDKNENKISAINSQFENGFITAKASNFGNYFVTIDTVLPTIEPVNVSTLTGEYDTLCWYFEAKDNFSGIASYNAYLHGNWILLDYDAKRNILCYKFDKVMYDLVEENKKRAIQNIAKIKYQLLINVCDKKGNNSEYKEWIELE